MSSQADDSGDAAPPAAAGTPRARLAAALREGPASAHELSRRLRISEKDVVHHLEHLARSARGRGERLVIEPAACLACGFVFRRRERTGKPGSCPSCRGTRIAAPRFALESRGGG